MFKAQNNGHFVHSFVSCDQQTPFCNMNSVCRAPGRKQQPRRFTLCLVCSALRLVEGVNRCVGILEVKHRGVWRRVEESDRRWDQEHTAAVCRELDCGSAVYGEQRGHFALSHAWIVSSDCVKTSPVRRCVSGSSISLRGVDVMCSGLRGENDSPGELRLVGGASRCSGTVELKHKGVWRRVFDSDMSWDQKATAAVCRDLDCGSAVYGEQTYKFPSRPMWQISSHCVKKSSVRECVSGLYSFSWGLEVLCSESVRLVSGSSLCSGLVQIWEGSWTWVCDGDLDQRGAEVLCRELGCGAPSLLQGALSPLGQTFHCEGHESALMDCPRSNSSTCSSGTTVNLTCSGKGAGPHCSEPLRLVGGASRCAGTLEARLRGEWRRVFDRSLLWDQEDTAAVCRALDCGFAVHGEQVFGDIFLEAKPVWELARYCVKKSSVRGCVYLSEPASHWSLEMKCSESVRLVSGSGLCSGSVQIWDGSWTGVCDGDLDQRGAEVLCRELGCGAPSLLQGALSPLGQTFHCEGHESALMDCPRSNSSTCSSGATVNLTCSEPLRLVGRVSRCAGTVELSLRGEWRRVYGMYSHWDQEATSVVCRALDCGAPVFGEHRGGFPWRVVWLFSSECAKKSSVKQCSTGSFSTSWGVEVKCSESVRLVSGSSLCSGSVQIWEGSWTGVCDGDLDQRGAEVLCRELGCGAPSLLQGALSPLGQTFHCEGHESALMDCPRSNSSTCSSGATVNLTCSEPIRLVGGASRCVGTLEVKLGGEWRRVAEPYGPWAEEDTAVVCRDLNCGSAVRGECRDDFPQSPVWRITPYCVRNSSVRGCVIDSSSSSFWGVGVVCSEAALGRGSSRE
ncbi:scavenger receptor cysteine-rich type 1 protein M160-like isoform X2 [Boleophthalmus pectinirostris]|uniref:scavenger receptor cysteine-rich type 1 protein M160-like isoform X2 n=1 Tax=Boleophthalmus pectinirostris TaxID=150288 RepID=UPI0024326CE1|nr:scavenger receptor cysteine-rich type 1 protein M160-like isoform X2 [Boleophthalmus pectinirostris]